MPAWRAPRGKPVTSHNPSGWTSCCIRPEAAAPGRRRHPADNSSPRQPTAPDPLRVMPECRTSEPDSDPPGPPAETHRSVGHAPRAWGLAWPEGMTVGSSVLKAVLGAQGLGLLAAGGGLVRKLGAATLRNKPTMMRRIRISSSPLAAPGRWPLALCGGGWCWSRWPVCWWWRWPAPGRWDPARWRRCW